MTRGRMDRLFKKLDAIGLGFEEGESRYLNKFYGKSVVKPLASAMGI